MLCNLLTGTLALAALASAVPILLLFHQRFRLCSPLPSHHLLLRLRLRHSLNLHLLLSQFQLLCAICHYLLRFNMPRQTHRMLRFLLTVNGEVEPQLALRLLCGLQLCLSSVKLRTGSLRSCLPQLSLMATPLHCSQLQCSPLTSLLLLLLLALCPQRCLQPCPLHC